MTVWGSDFHPLSLSLFLFFFFFFRLCSLILGPIGPHAATWTLRLLTLNN